MIRLKELRKKNELTQEKLADKIGVSKITVLRWENGERQIKPDKAKILADFFDVPIAYLLGFIDTPYIPIEEATQYDNFETLDEDYAKAQSMIKDIKEKLSRLDLDDINLIETMTDRLLKK